MGAYAYCQKCDVGLPKPTAREIIEGVQFCPQGHSNIVRSTKAELLIEMEERITVLENTLKTLTSLGAPNA